MKLSSAAIGLTAIGAGWLVARMVLARRGGETEPPSPEQLIGRQPPHPDAHHLSAQEAAEAFHSSKPQPS